MALAEYPLRTVVDLLTRQLLSGEARTGRAASFSYPDVIVAPKALADILGEERMGRVRWLTADQAAPILRWHQPPPVLGITGVPETHSLFAQYGCVLDCFDLGGFRGDELLYDLNHPLPEEYHNRYDLVVEDVLGQCFNPAQVLFNALRLVRPGGHVVHGGVLARPGQGFYSISPSLYEDFYAANGGEVVSRRVLRGIYDAVEVLKSGRHNVTVEDTNLVVARKTADVPPVMPIMIKFRVHKDSRG